MVDHNGSITDELRRFKEILNDADLESSPCKVCNNGVFWGFEFCMFCGALNEHYNPEFDEFNNLQEDCEAHHRNLKEWQEEGFCTRCGSKIPDQ